MASKKWLDNAFWETPEKKVLNAILEIKDDSGREHRHVMKINKIDNDGKENPDFKEVIKQVTQKKIDENTQIRLKRKKSEREEKKQKEEEHRKARKLEELFQYKMDACEVDHVKNSKDRLLRSKIRRSKSKSEVDLWTFMLLISEIKKCDPDNYEIIRKVLNESD